jgi:predicted ABC-type ATPase
MFEPIIAEFKERFSVNAAHIEKLKEQSIAFEIELYGIKPVENPKLIIVGGQPGAGKSDLQKFGELELASNVVVLSTDVLRSYHPYEREIKKNYPDYYHILTVDLARILLINLENYALANKLNVILESTLGNSEVMLQKIGKYRRHDYQIDLKVIAVNELISYLGAEDRYENMILAEKSGRMVSKQNHDQNYKDIPTTLQMLQDQNLLDNVAVYQRKTSESKGNIDTQVVLLTNNPSNFVRTYIEERSRPFSDLEKLYLKQTAESVQAMKQNRVASLLERARFEANFKLVLGDGELKEVSIGISLKKSNCL